jgi:hypothetical protein
LQIYHILTCGRYKNQQDKNQNLSSNISDSNSQQYVGGGIDRLSNNNPYEVEMGRVDVLIEHLCQL